MTFHLDALALKSEMMMVMQIFKGENSIFLGYEGMLAVMLSPFQQVPPPPSNAGNTVVDPLCGTYESTEEYQAFLKEEAEAASAPPAAPLPLDRQLEVMMEQERMLNPWKYSAELGKQTPLLEFLRTTGAGGDDGKGKERKVKREKKKKVKDEQQPIPLNATEDKRGPLKVKSKAKQQTQQQAQPASSAVPVATIEKQAPPLKIMSRPKTNNPTKTAAATTKAKPETTATPAVVGGAGPKVFTTSSKKTQQGSQQHAKPPLTSQHQQQYPQQQKKKEAQ